MSKRRKQIYIEEHQEAVLKQLSARHGQSEAMIMREALDRYLGSATMRTLLDPAAWQAEREQILKNIRGKHVKGRRTWTRDEIHDRR
jgi:hypothetical protein